MITQIRTATIHDGKVPEAFAMAVKVAEYVNDKFGVHLQVARSVADCPYEVHWIVTTESLAAWEDLWKRMEGDEGYNAILTEIREADLLIGASIVDRLYETIG